jgi:thiamine biosynthesis lipoprotein
LEINGTRYSHIIDPRTGWGLTHRNLVTVKAPNATIADAWATALSVLGPEQWARLAEEHPELEVWIIQSKL